MEQYRKLEGATHCRICTVSNTAYGYTWIPNELATNNNMFLLYRETDGKYEYQATQRVMQQIYLIVSVFEADGGDIVTDWESQNTIRGSVRRKFAIDFQHTLAGSPHSVKSKLTQLEQVLLKDGKCPKTTSFP